MPMAKALPDEKILLYARNLIHRQTEDLNREFLWQPEDALSECYCKGCTDMREAKRVVREFILTESRIAMTLRAEDNDYHIPVTLKFCSKCNELKSVHEFIRKTDLRTGMEFHTGTCNTCRNNRKRVTDSTPQAKEKAKARWERFKQRHGIGTSK